jgi:ornithine cyclodeaminase/alanine dehydrogenase-like protein (mu-crystallin family)
VVVDTRGGGVDGAGDLSGPVADGTLNRDSVLELGDILRDPPAEAAGVRVFKSVGFAAADVVSAWAVMAAARDAGLGHEVDLHR